jgi:hypothetical protein
MKYNQTRVLETNNISAILSDTGFELQAEVDRIPKKCSYIQVIDEIMWHCIRLIYSSKKRRKNTQEFRVRLEKCSHFAAPCLLQTSYMDKSATALGSRYTVLDFRRY